MERIPSLLVQTIQGHRLSNSFQGNSIVMTGIRMLVQIYSRKLSHVELPQNSDIDHSQPLSQTAHRVLSEF
jgi:hypothetical protein